jgi:hypothetical protein
MVTTAMANFWNKGYSVVPLAMLLALSGATARAADFQDKTIGQWRVYRTAVRGANACQIALNANSGLNLPTWSFNAAIYDNGSGPLIDLQGLYAGNDASLYAATPKKVAAVATIDGQTYTGDGAVNGEGVTSYDSNYRGADAANLAARLLQPIRQLTLTVGGQTITPPTQDLDKAFALAEQCYPAWVGHPLVWQVAEAQPMPAAPESQQAPPPAAVQAPPPAAVQAPSPTAMQVFTLFQVLQQGYAVVNVAVVPAAEARTTFNMQNLGALALVTLLHGNNVAVCTLALQDWVYTNPQAFAQQLCRTP